MTAYIIRRLLLIIPTIFGMMLVTFVVVQFAPGGPVERVLAVLSGADTGAGSRVPGGGQGGDFGARGTQAGPQARRRLAEIPRRAGPRSEIHREPGAAVRLRQAGARALLHDVVELSALRFRTQLFPRRDRSGIDQGEIAGLDLARHLADAAQLPDLDPARHPQGGARRLHLRRMDLGRHHHRLCAAGVPGRGAADRAVRRRIVLRLVPAARTDLGELRVHAVVATDPRLSLAHGAADHLARAGGLRHHDVADQELVPRRDPQAIRAHRARQGLQRAPGPLRARVPQRDADRHRRISGRVRARVLHRRAADRGDLFA